MIAAPIAAFDAIKAAAVTTAVATAYRCRPLLPPLVLLSPLATAVAAVIVKAAQPDASSDGATFDGTTYDSATHHGAAYHGAA